MVFLTCLIFFGSYNTTLMQAAIPQGFDGFLRIGLEQHFLNREQINIYSQNIEVGLFIDGEFFVMQTINSHTHFTAMAGYGGIVLMADGAVVFVADNPGLNLQLRCVSGITNLGVRQYRGIIEFGQFNTNGITAVNIVHMDEYLFSVVPSEMPALWHIEALKAQAVAARTFAMNRLSSPRTANYSLCDTVFSQVYSGVDREHPNTTQAVIETSGLVLMHNGRLISAWYSSCAGGFTANSEDVWASVEPFARAVPELYPSSLADWERTITHAQLQQLLTAQNIHIGAVQSVELHKNNIRRVMQFRIIGNSGTHTLERENIRSFFGSLEIGGGSLRSRVFTIAGQGTQPLNEQFAISAGGTFAVDLRNVFVISAFGTDTTNMPNSVISAQGVRLLSTAHTPNTTNIVSTSDYSFTLVGQGFGHGVGMSQHGARAMADNGHSFDNILRHYYTGIDIVRAH